MTTSHPSGDRLERGEERFERWACCFPQVSGLDLNSMWKPIPRLRARRRRSIAISCNDIVFELIEATRSLRTDFSAQIVIVSSFDAMKIMVQQAEDLNSADAMPAVKGSQAVTT